MLSSSEISHNTLCGEYSPSSRRIFSRDNYFYLGDTPPMEEITRKFVLDTIIAGVEKHGSIAAYERAARIPKGHVKDIQKWGIKEGGTEIPRADRWERMKKAAETTTESKNGNNGNAAKEDAFTQTEIGLMSAIRAIIIILSNYDVIRQNTLKDVFSYQQKDFRMRAQPGAAAVMNQLIEFLNDSPLPENEPAAHKSSPPERGQSKNEKSLEN